jgi:hypothetical protein
MSRLSHLRSRRLAVIGAVAALGSGVGSIGLLSAASPAGAAPMIVNCPTDNLQDAIRAAPSNSTINVSGTCTGNFRINNKNLTLHGPATLDGNNAGTVLSVNGGSSSSPSVVTLSSLTIQHGNGDGDGGGGIFNLFGTVTLNSSLVSNNTAVLGGGIRNLGGTLNLNSSSVSGNASTEAGAGQGGGGIFIDRDTVNVNSSLVTNNTAADSGGGILNLGATVTVKSSSVSDNTAAVSGGGIRNLSALTVKSSSVFNNSAGTGGGIFNRGTATVTSSSVFNNTARDQGGGIFNSIFAGASFTLLSSSVTGNTPDNCAPPNSVPGCSG